MGPEQFPSDALENVMRRAGVGFGIAVGTIIAFGFKFDHMALWMLVAVALGLVVDHSLDRKQIAGK